MTKPSTRQSRFWPGPLRPTVQRRAIDSTRCVGIVRDPAGQDVRCAEWTINGDFLCYGCKDPEGYAARLRLAQQEARQRCLEAYPVCKHCGARLTAAQVKDGQTSHRYVDKGKCKLTTDERAVQGWEA
jgi:hypothetical protein